MMAKTDVYYSNRWDDEETSYLIKYGKEKTYAEIAEYLGRTSHSVQNKAYKMGIRKKFMSVIAEDRKETGQLCWTCKRASNENAGCPWVKNFDPVPGWDAIFRDDRDIPGGTYEIRGCPLYEEEKRNWSQDYLGEM